MDRKTEKELLDIVMDNYEKIAVGFSVTRDRPIWPETLEIFKEAKDHSSVLDVGCGNGRLFAALRDKKVKYLGVDLSKGLINEALKKYSDAQFRTANILELGKIPEYNFDYVVAIAILHHLPGNYLRIKALKQLKNKIKQDGEIIVTVWNLWSREKFRKMIFKFFFLKLLGKNNMDFGDILFEWKKEGAGYMSKRYYHAFTKRSLQKIAKKAGLKIVKYKKDKDNYHLVLKKAI